jgi:hypothetical protein
VFVPAGDTLLSLRAGRSQRDCGRQVEVDLPALLQDPLLLLGRIAAPAPPGFVQFFTAVLLPDFFLVLLLLLVAESGE